MKRLSHSERQSDSPIQVLCDRHSYVPQFNVTNLVFKTENHCQGQEEVTEAWGIHAQKSHSKESVENRSVTKKAHMNTITAKYWPLLVCHTGAYGVYTWKWESRRRKNQDPSFQMFVYVVSIQPKSKKRPCYISKQSR